MKNYLRYIWKKYPVQFNDVKEGNDTITYITFAPEAYHTSCFENTKSVPEDSTAAADADILVSLLKRDLESQIISYISANSARQIQNPVSVSLSQENSGPVNEPMLCVRETWTL